MRPRGVGYLPDIQVAVPVHRQRMRRDECAMFHACPRRAEAAKQLALMVKGGDARSDVRIAPVDIEERPKRTHEEDRLPRAVHQQSAGAEQIVPLRNKPAVAIEYLDTIILAVGDVDESVGVAA